MIGRGGRLKGRVGGAGRECWVGQLSEGRERGVAKAGGVVVKTVGGA